ncbi:M15 family metallopeptidase [Aestuariibacter salexigens]|uniref:M15 family metallopeptidase n=1 Tax=Aestuariibacter salexigens TaxID=226010 RepID=UPI0003F802B6|nr:M15 family metallopeptidase [Aestuariibacter salexigens]
MITTAQWLGQSETHLSECQDGHYLHTDVCDAFKRMQHAARESQVGLNITSGFRGFERQLLIWNSKWRGDRPLYDRQGKRLDANALSDTEKLFSILIWSALPGGSRHHWGTDLDVYDKKSVDDSGHDFELITQEYEPGGPCYDLSVWLDEHAERFGFYRPYAQETGGVSPEPWHISYRPLAGEILAAVNIEDIFSAINEADILGKHVILDNLDKIYRTFILNGETA